MEKEKERAAEAEYFASLPVWEKVDTNLAGQTLTLHRLPVPGGYLYRDGGSIMFVPAKD